MKSDVGQAHSRVGHTDQKSSQIELTARQGHFAKFRTLLETCDELIDIRGNPKQNDPTIYSTSPRQDLHAVKARLWATGLEPARLPVHSRCDRLLRFLRRAFGDARTLLQVRCAGQLGIEATSSVSCSSHVVLPMWQAFAMIAGCLT